MPPTQRASVPQQPSLAVHAPPVALQHVMPKPRLRPQVRPMAQHSGAGRPSRQVTPSPRTQPVMVEVVHTPLTQRVPEQQFRSSRQRPPAGVQSPVPRHMPSRHSAPLQQSVGLAQRSPSPEHIGAAAQVPRVHVSPVQHAASVEHAPPAGAHMELVWQVPRRHASPVQQAEVAAQAAPAAAHMVAARHRPAVQVVPMQQSALVVQTLPLAWHAQRPDAHVMDPQQSSLVRHAAAASAQQVATVGLALHDSPPQHSGAPVGHGAPGAVHAAGRHTPPSQPRPVQQSALVAQREPLA